MARYQLTCNGEHWDSGDNALELTERHFDTIRDRWRAGWIIEDLEPVPLQHTVVWTVHWAHAYNGVELTPLMRL